jgi:hypothetical protein
MMYTRIEIDMPTVHATITRRSVSEPRTKAMASASAMPMAVSRIVSGTSTVSDGPRRLAMMCATGSPVAQAVPKSNVTTARTPVRRHPPWSAASATGAAGYKQPSRFPDRSSTRMRGECRTIDEIRRPAPGKDVMRP